MEIPAKPKTKKEKPNVLAKGSRTKQASERPAPSPPSVESAPLLAEEGSHTSIVLDRIWQWEPLTAYCASRQTHILFVVHGTREQNLSLFMKRIKKFLPRSCTAFPHHVVDVEGKYDRISARTANEWKRSLIAKSEAGSGEFVTVFPTETAQSSPVFMFMIGDGPLRLDKESVQGFVDLFKTEIDPAIQALEIAGKLKHPLRFVLPVERAFTGVDLMLDALLAGLRGLRVLHLEPLTEIVFPPWAEVWEFVTDRFEGADKDIDLHSECKRTYEKVAQMPGRTLQMLGDKLHPTLYAWEAQQTLRKR